MNIKHVLVAAIIGMLGIAPLFPARASDGLSLEGSLISADADKELDQFFKAKESVFNRDWSQARKQLEKFLRDFPASRLGDEALFWLAKSLNGCAARESSRGSAIALKKEAFGTLERLGREHPASAWKNDAEEMRIEIAGELVLLGAGEYEGFIHEYAASRKADETTLKLAALNSLIRLKPKTAFAALAESLERDGAPRLRREAAALLGKYYDREALPALEKTVQSDKDTAVREEASYWAEQIRIRLIPADFSYYALAAQVIGDAARRRMKEGVLNRFTSARKPAGEAAARRIISQFFDNQVGEYKSSATARRIANDFILQPKRPLNITVSHRLHDFQISIVPGSVQKNHGQITGEIVFVDFVSGERRSETFTIDGQNDQIFAARRGDNTAVILLQFEPVAGNAAAETEDEDESSPTGIVRLLSRIFGGPSDREPVYYTLYSNYMGCRVHTTLQSTFPDDSSIMDFSLAKAEIPAKGESQGTWILTGHLLGLKKERTFKARRASLINPAGKIVAVADEITIAVDDPADFRVQGSRLADKEVAEWVRKVKVALPPAPETPPKAAAHEQTCELENGVKVYYTSAERIGPEALRGPVVEFGRARVEIPVPEGTWVLTGIVRWISHGSLFMSEQSTLTDPQKSIRAKDVSILVPTKKPDKFTILDR